MHQGGVGTTAQALRASQPMPVVPFAHDQPDNAARAARLGLARQVSRKQYQARSVAAGLRTLLENSDYASRAAEVGRRIRAEDGVSSACDLIERLLQ